LSTFEKTFIAKAEKAFTAEDAENAEENTKARGVLCGLCVLCGENAFPLFPERTH
jgi:hypothetical protein